MLVGSVSASQPQYLGWRARLIDQANEVKVLGEYDRLRLTSGLEDRSVLGVS
jgi:hypothetical protein